MLAKFYEKQIEKETKSQVVLAKIIAIQGSLPLDSINELISIYFPSKH